ncbi:hypothetical protein HCG49_02355 [Arenibacter sp. 6A1]|uniref:hypothetical protein n=1 Tax=Arenibacter sp. 6A1 TaxID=2720391 RepID=UPI0014477494|nr:hypothetical protein [Arenibacter sp. 6A1]NKI25399.1 hypothetical protein [Arenibacter sp. 6A1]
MKRLIALGLTICLLGCAKENEGGDTEAMAPTPVTLVFPDNNTECSEGTVIDDKKTSIVFQWNPSENTDSYTLEVKNLNTGTTSIFPINTTEKSITVERGVPYSWAVTSTSSTSMETAKSDTWQFYSSGEGVSSYAPFPAAIISPADEAKTTATNNLVTLEWKGSDVDGDIVSYDVYFGDTESLEPLVTELQESKLENVQVSAGTTYYWKIKTNDSQGNSSFSNVFNFHVN